jgi:hypothetical protein
MMNAANKTSSPVMTPEQFAHLGGGTVAYVKAMKGSEVQRLFPQVGAIEANITLYALLGADGSPILLTDSKDAALANAWQHDLQPVSLH